jgi:hypothetical protein
MHTTAEHTPVEQLPVEIADLLARIEIRRTKRQAVWSEHLRAMRAWKAGRDRAASRFRTAREAEISVDTDGMEL